MVNCRLQIHELLFLLLVPSKIKAVTNPSPVYSHSCTCQYAYIHTLRIHKRMVRFQKMIKMYFFSCVLRNRETSFQDGVAAGEGFLCVQF
jgi:hypothetical protein